MIRLASNLVLFAVLILGVDSLRAQPGSAASVNFRNDMPQPVIVQGISYINGMPRRGQPLYIGPGKSAWDNNVPPGTRRYTIYDGMQPSRVLNPSVAVDVQSSDLLYVVQPGKGGKADVVPQ
jgi:hypothetical protein